MRIIFLIKKGLQCFPPCLTQILLLHDLGADLIVYHGKNTPTINAILDSRQIIHYEYSSDKESRNLKESAINFLNFCLEFRNLFSFSNNDIIWFGNVETVLAADLKKLKNYNYILNVLELYDKNILFDKKLQVALNNSFANLCCEKHRAAIMQTRYKLRSLPHVFFNRPYPLNEYEIKNEYQKIIEKYADKFIVIYQGLIDEDRRLDTVAEALNEIDDNNIFFFVLGKCNNDYIKYMQNIYCRTVFFGYVPAPEHLTITSKCHIGIASYSTRNLNNIFCAPNKIYEYAKYGIPIICSMNIGLIETVGFYKAGECIDFNKTQEIVNAIRKVRLNYDKYSAAALRLYDESDNSEVIKTIYDSLLCL